MTGIDNGSNQHNWYEIQIQGHLDPRWSASLDGLSLAHHSDGTTVARGPVIDQTALHGLLARLRDIGLPLLSVTRVDADQPHVTTHADQPIGD